MFKTDVYVRVYNKIAKMTREIIKKQRSDRGLETPFTGITNSAGKCIRQQWSLCRQLSPFL
jgi:hypothetical protein